MGAVYRAEQLALKRTVALKVLRPELSADPGMVRRFNAEAELAARLSHPNTVTLYDFGQDSDGSLFIAMEYLEGRSLREVLTREGALGPGRALAICEQLCSSLSDAHAHGIVHRDLKPDNVMLVQRGRQADVVRVLDFGIAKLRDDQGDVTAMPMTRAGDLLGTPQYMAPEQIRGETVDARTDVYALGAMLYEMVTGRLPFEAATLMAILSKHLTEMPVPPRERRPELAIPSALNQLIMDALQKAPADRPPTMDAFADRLGRVAIDHRAGLAATAAQGGAGKSFGSTPGGGYPMALTDNPPPGVPHPRTPAPAGGIAFGATATPPPGNPVPSAATPPPGFGSSPPGYASGPPAAPGYASGPPAAPGYASGPPAATPGYASGPAAATPGYASGPPAATPGYASGPAAATPGYASGPAAAPQGYASGPPAAGYASGPPAAPPGYASPVPGPPGYGSPAVALAGHGSPAVAAAGYASPVPGPFSSSPAQVAASARPATGHPAPRSGRGTWIVVGALVAAAAGGVAVFFAVRGGGSKSAAAPTPAAVAPPGTQAASTVGSDFTLKPERELYAGGPSQASPAHAGHAGDDEEDDDAEVPAAPSVPGFGQPGIAVWEGGWWKDPTGTFQLDVPRGFSVGTGQAAFGGAAMFAGDCGGAPCTIQTLIVPTYGMKMTDDMVEKAVAQMPDAMKQAGAMTTVRVQGRDRYSVVVDNQAEGMRGQLVIFTGSSSLAMVLIQAPVAGFDATAHFRKGFFEKRVRIE